MRYKQQAKKQYQTIYEGLKQNERLTSDGVNKVKQIKVRQQHAHWTVEQVTAITPRQEKSDECEQERYSGVAKVDKRLALYRKAICAIVCCRRIFTAKPN